MAHFRGQLQGNRGRASRLGTKDSGLWLQGNGWDIGFNAHVTYNKEKDRDEIQIYLTDGSNPGSTERFILRAWKDDRGNLRTEVNLTYNNNMVLDAEILGTLLIKERKDA